MAVAAVIGGSGRMGAWFANFLSSNGYEVIICDKNVTAARRMTRSKGFKFDPNPIRAAQVSEIVLFATPTLTTKSLLKKITQQTARTTLLVEISSIKEPVRKTIENLNRRGARIMSIHPMFGPGSNLMGKSIIIAQEPANCVPARKLLSTFTKRGAKIIRSSLEDHDQLVATTLALPHWMNFAFVETMKCTGLSLDKARDMGGTTFKLQLLIAEALYHESLHNEASILTDNKHNRKTLAYFTQQIKQLQRETPTELLGRLRSDSAYVRKSKLFNRAHERFIAAVEASS